ncbi:Alpha/Beta hydrolase protein [Mycena rebaudengoi]|nr:Alpha/Beta hydrolase protein [Mycena rebaudengoi]
MFLKSLTRVWAVTTMLLAAHAQTGPTVNLGYAEYQGTVNSVINITNFLGIRYAAAPLGELRFRGPKPPANVSGVQLATTQPNQCLQAAKGTSNTNPLSRRAAQVLSPEDCLFLNVYHPSHVDGTPSAEGLPTLVWIHMGGYLYGVARDFNGEDIVLQSNRGVVVVIIQYRLGLFGFLPGAAVNNNGTLNAGLRKALIIINSIRTLRYDGSIGISRNLAVILQKLPFGASQLVILPFSNSLVISLFASGGGSVLQHIIANNGQTQPPLFRGAIASSPFLPSQYRYNDRIPELIFSQIANQANCSSAAESMVCLRDTDVNTLQTINTDLNLKAYFGTFFLVPVIDGTFIITQSATKSLAEGKVNEKAYALNLLFPKLSEEQADTVTSLYAGVGNDLMRFRESGSFAVPPGGHGRDVRYYFPSQGPLDFPNSIFINAFAQSFTSFIISLDPNVKVDLTTITPPWSLYSEGNTDMLFNRTASGVPVVEPTTTPDDLLERCCGQRPNPESNGRSAYDHCNIFGDGVHHALSSLSAYKWNSTPQTIEQSAPLILNRTGCM